MTKAIIISIAIITILLSSIIFYYANKTDAVDIASYNARKEDLYLSQKKTEQLLSDLNQSLALEAQNQKILIDKITELSAKADLPPPIINTTKVVQPDPIIVPVTPKPVTRAS
ncbi:MAG: hypothetical protein ACP5OA_03360 [Candidatus Woesearchaeota archaeon]